MIVPPRESLHSIHVGAGGRGKTHLRAALDSGYCRPVGLVDVVPEHLTTARETTGLPEAACFTRVEDALAAIESDVVVVASPVMFHAQQILAALRANRHVLTEKCFTVGLADALVCVAEAEARDRRVMVVQNARLTPAMRTLRRLIAEECYGALGLFQFSLWYPRGAPYHPSPHMYLWQQGVHELDSLLSVVQRPVRRVWGLSSNPTWCDWPSESTVQAILECDGGVSGSFLGTTNARAEGFEFRLECADAAIVCKDRSAGALEVRWGPRDRRSEMVPLDPVDVRGLERVPAAMAVLASDDPGRGVGVGRLANLQIYRNFYEYVTDGKEPESSGRRNLDTMRLLDAVVRSTAERRPVDLG